MTFARSRLLVAACFLVGAFVGQVPSQAAKPADENAAQGNYDRLVAQSRPSVVWHFEGEQPLAASVPAAEQETPATWEGKAVGKVAAGREGPRGPLYPLFGQSNRAAEFDGRKAFVSFQDPGEQSVLDFDLGDSITLEAWVNLASLNENQQVYVVGKGRTGNPGVDRDNQNYALRLRGEGGLAKISFLFRSAAEEGSPSEFHRWNSTAGFAPGSGWRHIAVSYTFGVADSLRGYLDGQPTEGTWDYGGATARPPVVDNDELWIGSSMGGSAGSTFHGLLDAVAIYRRAVPHEEIAAHFAIDPQALLANLPDPPDGRVLVEIVEGAAANSWQLPPRANSIRSYEQGNFTLFELPRKYNDRGVIDDFAAPLMVRAIMKKELPAGSYDFMLRSLDGARLLIDGRQVAQTRFLRTGGDAHGDVPVLAAIDDPEFYPAAIGHAETVVTVELAGGEHVFQLEALAGGKNNRPEIGELCVGFKPTGESRFAMLSPADEFAFPLTFDGWNAFATIAHSETIRLNREQRRERAEIDAPYWRQRHEIARQIAQEKPPIEVPDEGDDLPASNEIDRLINARLLELGEQPSAITSDLEFIRRVSLDVRGIIPRPDEIAAFMADQGDDRRERLIDRFLDDPRWADHWVPYWQDVLAENPGILKPMLNNTGPFRYWIRESFADNKPFDRFVTELLLMEGSTYYGGPAGFAMATQNDAPMAAKAHVAAQAFLGVEMQCARCHDAPYHPHRQSDLFELGAMLARGPVKLPRSSTVPHSPGARQPLVEITLKPGDVLQPVWPFAEQIVEESLPEGFLRAGDDSRARAAALFTSPYNDRFAQVVVNRIWQRYLGTGIVEPVDDWYDAEPSHPALLELLARELVMSGYDLKHVARMILNSQAYQRRPIAAQASEPAARSFAGPARRRLTAEQLVDSLFVASDKEFGAETLTLDVENRLSVKTFLNLGTPTRSWEFVTLSNERDRPALALPVAQSFVDLLAMFGWRNSRQNPIAVREQSPTALQPLTLGNGLIGARVATLSDDSAFTRLALAEQSPRELIDAVTLRILSRPATSAEHELFLPLIGEGYQQRVVSEPAPAAAKPRARHAVSWTNHLSAEATRIKNELEEAARRGDVPTARLEPQWRERMEDMVWALANSPEFMFMP